MHRRQYVTMIVRTDRLDRIARPYLLTTDDDRNLDLLGEHLVEPLLQRSLLRGTGPKGLNGFVDRFWNTHDSVGHESNLRDEKSFREMRTRQDPLPSYRRVETCAIRQRGIQQLLEPQGGPSESKESGDHQDTAQGSDCTKPTGRSESDGTDGPAEDNGSC